MKILIIANSKVVFGKELKSELVKKNFDVSLLDFQLLTLYDKDDYVDKTYANQFEKYKFLKKISMFFRMIAIKKVLQNNDFDIINIHISRWYYLIILPWIAKKKIVITFYGSDFYRTSDIVRNVQVILYNKAHALTFTNPITKKKFTEYYNSFENKSYVCRFGLKTLEYIDRNRFKSKKELKKSLGYNSEKIIVTCGYNSTKEQQHEMIINNLLKLSSEFLTRIQFVFPMTYGDYENKELIKSILNQSDLDFIVLEKYLYGEDNADIKLASDIMINMLETDSFSGSMQEFLYANNIIITGSWLPYEVFDNAGIQYVKIDDIGELSQRLKKVIEEDITSFDTSKNKNIISELSLWRNTLESWLNVYMKL